MAILIGHAPVGIGVLNTLILARLLLNGAVSIILCAYALSVCRRGKVAMFALLLMPMTLSLFASSSQDATLIALACVGFSLISRQLDRAAPMSRTTAAVVFVVILLIAIGRPPNAALALAFFIPGLLPSRSKTRELLTAVVLTGVTVTITMGWWIAVILATRGISQPFAAGSNVDPKLQLMYLLHHPHIIVPMLGYFVHHITYYIAGVIGILGWLDTPLPAMYYLAMMLVLAGAIFAELARGPAIPRCVIARISFASLVGIAGVFFIEYLNFTPVGGTDLDGTQGRHLIPLPGCCCGGVADAWSILPKTYARATAIVVL